MTLLETPSYGKPSNWPWPAKIVCEIAWALATAPARESVTAELAGADIINNGKLTGSRFILGMRYLLTAGIIQVKDEMDWDTMTLNPLFVAEQQQAQQERTDRTRELAKKLISAMTYYRAVSMQLISTQTFEKQQAVQKKVSAAIKEVQAIAEESYSDKYDQAVLIAELYGIILPVQVSGHEQVA